MKTHKKNGRGEKNGVHKKEKRDGEKEKRGSLPSPKKVPAKKWVDSDFVRAYELAKQDLPLKRIALSLGYTPWYFAKLVKKKPALADAIDKGKHSLKVGNGSLRDFVYGTLPKRLLGLWKELEILEECEPGVNVARKFLSKEPLRIRQHLFLHAFWCCNFNLSAACAKVGIDNATPKRWAEDDPNFSDLVNGIVQCKKDFFENALIELVRQGDPHAIIFCNRTINRDRGYHEKHEVKVDITSTHKVEVEDLGLSLETKKEILERLRAKREANTPRLPYHPDVDGDSEQGIIDAEYTEARRG